LREFEEETGKAPPDPAGAEWLGEQRLPSGKVVSAWAVEGDVDVGDIQSNTFEMEWPPRSGRTQEFPEVDRASWFGIEEAGSKLHRGQAGFIARLLELLEERALE
jgi:predicted NUDIX family NTP pyrophosphohydrolase